MKTLIIALAFLLSGCAANAEELCRVVCGGRPAVLTAVPYYLRRAIRDIFPQFESLPLADISFGPSGP
jgi:hypothetical protein